jgi:periplasmic divalent cation tolerance protein
MADHGVEEEMHDVLLVLCTFPDIAQARQIGTLLIERQLAACVNLLSAAESIYRWQGAIEAATETLAIFKTTAASYPAFRAALTDLHPYEVPELVAIAPRDVADAYAKWVTEQVSGARELQ